MLGSEKEFDITKARTHGPGRSILMFKVECEDHSAIQAPQFRLVRLVIDLWVGFTPKCLKLYVLNSVVQSLHALISLCQLSINY